jgi:hypothetical protein
LSQGQQQRENKAREREEKRLRRAEQRRQELYLRIIAGGSQNYKQYIVTQFRKLRDNPYGKLWLMLYAAYQPPPKNGRPKKGQRKWERFGVPERITWEEIQAEYKALMDRRPVGCAHLVTAKTPVPDVDKATMESAERNHIAVSGDGNSREEPVVWGGEETQRSVLAEAA